MQTIAAKLNEMYDLAKEMRNPSAGTAAAMGLGKLFGLITDKAQIETAVTRRPARSPDAPVEMSLEAWMEMVHGGRAESADSTDSGTVSRVATATAATVFSSRRCLGGWS